MADTVAFLLQMGGWLVLSVQKGSSARTRDINNNNSNEQKMLYLAITLI